MSNVRVVVAGLLLLLGGCSAARSAPEAPAPSSRADAVKTAKAGGTIPIEIDNQNFNDVDVYLIDQGAPVYLGSATSYTTTMLQIPAGSLVDPAQVRLLAHPVGGSSEFRTPKLLVAPGKSVHWTIGTDAATSVASTE
jgi:hypothetical protein